MCFPLPTILNRQISCGQTLYCIMYYPPNMDIKRKYPVILNIYGGPDFQLVTNTFKVRIVSSVASFSKMTDIHPSNSCKWSRWKNWYLDLEMFTILNSRKPCYSPFFQDYVLLWMMKIFVLQCRIEWRFYMIKSCWILDSGTPI